ncbi:MAG: DUF5711 family protein [Candidatus Treponema excrementipullorum]|nr:DUF5711 family protein [Spirochaetia bacterium]MCI7589987.1 DUF5711 family protein [Spirochaetia bacterium]MDD7012850.1 DUF5711 family protein [Candidatus Treponema excrementipullorum]MDY4707240.1 DUF5711 family protein [Candidatus Treponema excrementipullorum]
MIKKSSYTTLKQYELFGRSIKSANELYLLFWDLYSTNILLLKDEVVLYNLKSCITITAGDISDNGISVVAGYNNNKNYVCIYDEKGNELSSISIEARIFNIVISNDGEIIVFQTYNSMISENDSNKIFIFDIKDKRILSKFTCPLGWPTDYDFPHQKDIIRLFFDKKFIDYDLNGKCLEENKLPVVEKTPFEIFYETESEYLKISSTSTKQQVQDIYSKYKRISEKQLTPHILGVTFKRLGELSLLLKDNENALLYFEKANEIYPKIGVKKKIIALKKKDSLS